MLEVIQGERGSVKIYLRAKAIYGTFGRLTGEFECTSFLVGVLSQALVVLKKGQTKMGRM